MGLFSKSFQDYVHHVRQVLQRLLTNGIKLKPEKCKLFQKEVNYLGQIVSSEGYRPDPSKINAVTVLKHSISANVGEVRKLLGLQGPPSSISKTTSKTDKSNKAGFLSS